MQDKERLYYYKYEIITSKARFLRYETIMIAMAIVKLKQNSDKEKVIF